MLPVEEEEDGPHMVGPPEEAPFDEVDRAPIPVEVLAESDDVDAELEVLELDDAELEEDEPVVEVTTTHPPSAPGWSPARKVCRPR